MTNKLRRRTQLTLSTEHGDLELEFEPYNEDDVLIERVGDKLVVAYLVNDPCPATNPLKDYDCQGDLYTRSPRYGGGVITDNDAEFYRALGLGGYGEVDIDSIVEIDGHVLPLFEHAAQAVHDSLDHDDWCTLLLWCWKHSSSMDLTEDERQALESGNCSVQRRVHLVTTHAKELDNGLFDPHGYFSSRVESKAETLFAQHWQQIVGPYVVPVASSGGNYDTCYSPTTWDGDIEDLPDGVWVADKGAIENIGEGCRKGVVINRGSETYRGPRGWIVEADGRKVAFFPDNVGPGAVVNGQPSAYLQASDYVEQHYGDRPMDVHTAAVHYAAGVLDEYSKWCSGEVFGCVTQTFTLAKEPDEGEEPEWIADDDYDSCWGFIGEEYAEETLKDEFFDSVVERLKQAQAQPASN